ncbi:MAG TPA: hypothetical protein VMV86_04435 [Methanosarcinales archaeon]|nr:hypothetical protein [Methanosarcinales archaeon]
MKYALILLIFLAGCGEGKLVEKVDFEFICNSCFLENGSRGFGYFYTYDISNIPERGNPTPCFPCTSKKPENILEAIGKSVCQDLLENRRVTKLWIRHESPPAMYIYEHYLLANVWDDMMHPERGGLSKEEYELQIKKEEAINDAEWQRKFDELDGLDQKTGAYNLEKRLEEIEEEFKNADNN